VARVTAKPHQLQLHLVCLWWPTLQVLADLEQAALAQDLAALALDLEQDLAALELALVVLELALVALELGLEALELDLVPAALDQATVKAVAELDLAELDPVAPAQDLVDLELAALVLAQDLETAAQEAADQVQPVLATLDLAAVVLATVALVHPDLVALDLALAALVLGRDLVTAALETVDLAHLATLLPATELRHLELEQALGQVVQAATDQAALATAVQAALAQATQAPALQLLEAPRVARAEARAVARAVAKNTDTNIPSTPNIRSTLNTPNIRNILTIPTTLSKQPTKVLPAKQAMQLELKQQPHQHLLQQLQVLLLLEEHLHQLVTPQPPLLVLLAPMLLLHLPLVPPPVVSLQRPTVQAVRPPSPAMPTMAKDIVVTQMGLAAKRPSRATPTMAKDTMATAVAAKRLSKGPTMPRAQVNNHSKVNTKAVDSAPADRRQADRRPADRNPVKNLADRRPADRSPVNTSNKLVPSTHLQRKPATWRKRLTPSDLDMVVVAVALVAAAVASLLTPKSRPCAEPFAWTNSLLVMRFSQRSRHPMATSKLPTAQSVGSSIACPSSPMNS
jgi:hypothetical protein